MSLTNVTTIEQIIDRLDDIIEYSELNNSTFGYFAVLYQKVTMKVKEGVENHFFDNNERMEELDVIFAKRYLEAYYKYQEQIKVSASWEKAFSINSDYWPIVLQHLLIGMNAHINLDLGIAAAEVSKNHPIEDLKNDFNKINEILSSLVNEVQNDLAKIWPTLKYILQKTKKVDDFLVDFSMELARDGAWKFATTLANQPSSELEHLISKRDQDVADKANIITNPGFIANVILYTIRIGERGTVVKKTTNLKG
ncbi:MAG: hypothetical protein ACI9SJ_000168 [Flavobacteriaceae bacterium]|jgi:hypothetical protein|uniref:DUF5995 family protein n=1 Tax=Candidatus Marifrigoribacter sp. Uisw_064 TaxID=3230970 RepID=UPI003AEB742C